MSVLSYQIKDKDTQRVLEGRQQQQQQQHIIVSAFAFGNIYSNLHQSRVSSNSNSSNNNNNNNSILLPIHISNSTILIIIIIVTFLSYNAQRQR
mmetsp:Transcript_49702/g.55389  ORF Transcript_49702/g.55389 Transcript_49702/m.55389 type:complete len:94 (+) Transcript_49702:95-376(+)